MHQKKGYETANVKSVWLLFVINNNKRALGEFWTKPKEIQSKVEQEDRRGVHGIANLNPPRKLWGDCSFIGVRAGYLHMCSNNQVQKIVQYKKFR